jgi:type I restriction enzyme, S subunit
MPSNWKSTSLSEVAHIEMGQSPPSEFVSDEEGHGLAFLQGNAEFSSLHPNPRLWCSRPMKLANAGDALISVRAPVGAINRADQDYCIGRGLAAIRFDKMDPDFGFHALVLIAKALRHVAQGSTFEAVGGRELRCLQFPVVPLTEQHRIAEILDTLDEAIHKTEQVIAKLQQMKQGLLHDLLTRGIDENGELRDPERHPEQFKDSQLGRIPKDWDVVQFGKITVSSLLGTTVRGKASHGENIPLLKMGNLGWGSIDVANIEYVAKSRVKDLKTILLQNGDLLFNTRNTPELVGKTAVWNRELDEVITDNNILRVRFQDHVNSSYVGAYMSCGAGKLQVHQLSTGTTSVAAIYWKNLKGYTLPKPTLEEQNQVVKFMRVQYDRVASEVLQLKKLIALREGLMDDLLTGRVRVTVPKESTS